MQLFRTLVGRNCAMSPSFSSLDHTTLPTYLRAAPANDRLNDASRQVHAAEDSRQAYHWCGQDALSPPDQR